MSSELDKLEKCRENIIDENVRYDIEIIAKEILIEETITEYRLAHNTSWYKDIKKLEDIIGKKDSFVWTMEDQNPEIVIP
ncbi:hypothetical protein RhiirB3_427588 [Rhizophagus irregularis]|nr:hypothetical protein RhiirB3_427588 [Rhizophagus irregularis]